MNKTLARRLASLLPAGNPRYVRCYAEDDASSFDRFTVLFTGRAATCRMGGRSQYQYVGLSGHGFTNDQPSDTMSNGKRGWCRPPAIGRKCHLGRRVPFSAIPEGLRQVAMRDYREIWRLNEASEKAAA